MAISYRDTQNRRPLGHLHIVMNNMDSTAGPSTRQKAEWTINCWSSTSVIRFVKHDEEGGDEGGEGCTIHVELLNMHSLGEAEER